MKKEDWVEHFEGRGFRASVDAPSDMFYRFCTRRFEINSSLFEIIFSEN